MVTLKLLVEVCRNRHTGPCQVERKAPLPTRVIDLGVGNNITKDMVHLRESMAEENDHYITLSHCWRKLPITRTLKNNLDDMQKGIRLDSLPQTFQDAIWLTRWFDVRYLWIDSLCIIQDDNDDWKREASKMADVYGNSYLTIAASAAKDGSVGCLVPRTIPAARSFKVDLSSYGPDYGKTEVFVRRRLHQKGDSKYFLGKDLKTQSQAPLEERAWTFQESLLPRRILHFYGDEVVFQCESETICECLLHRSSTTRMKQLVLPEGSVSGLSDKWRSFVRQYSGRNITYLKDRLPALAGVASKFCDVTDGYYVAGMWKHSILDDLQWHTEVETPADRLHGGEGNYLPSWSWLSTSARVTWQSRGSVIPGQEYRQINEAKIHEVDTLIDKDFPLGQSPGAILLMEGFALPATIRYISPAEARASRGNSSAYVWPDYDYSKPGPDQVKDGSEVLLFLMCQQYTPPYFENSMLVLREIPTTGTEPEAYRGLHERIGYARYQIFNALFNPGEENPDFNFQGTYKISMLSK
jgi:Heterokaryon incompatibility protein (HET)